MKKQINLTTDEAIVLQQVHEDGEDDTQSLAQYTGMSRRYVVNLVANLRQKGLIAIDNTYGDIWVRATTKGKRLVQSLWPEAKMGAC